MLPRFTIRQLMLAMVVLAMFSAILGWAARGSMIAYGLGVAVLALVVPFLVYAFIYWICFALVSENRSTLRPAGKLNASQAAKGDSESAS